MRLLKEIEKLKRGSTKAALCLIVKTKGSTPRKVGSKMIVLEDGKIFGSIGGGNLEKKVIANALTQINKNEPKLFQHDLLHQHNMCCGGTVEIYIEPIEKMNKLYIFGAGHTGEALAKLACNLDFDVYLIDNREDYLNQINISNINKLFVDFNQILPSLPFSNSTYIAILTYEHEIDREILSHCIKQPHAYLGMIGSKRKIELTKKMFVEGKIATKKELEGVDMPIGIDISSQTPEEIAISIIAKIIKFKNEK